MAFSCNLWLIIEEIMSKKIFNTDVIVVGAGNAAMCAALAARERGAEVIVLERAPNSERGGNSSFTAGAMRFAYRDTQDLLKVVADLTQEEINNTDFGSYSEQQFYDDMCRVTQYRTDPDLADLLVSQSLNTMVWMRSKKVRFVPIYGRQAFKIDGKFKFWGGLTLEAVGGGPGLVESLTAAAKKNAIEIWYQARATSLVADDAGVHGVVVKHAGKTKEEKAKAVV